MRVVAVLSLVVAAVYGAGWRIVNHNVATVDLGVAFIDEHTGYTAGTMNGAGPAILKSTDGGVTFNPCNVTNWGADFLLMDIDAAGQSVVVSSIGGELYSEDGGKSFHQSIGGGLSQSVRHIGPNGEGGHRFAATGQFPLRNVNGVAVSVNNGKTFKTFDAKLYTPARYGAFPSDATWYISAGQWPATPPPPPPPPAKTPAFANAARALVHKSRIFGPDGRVAYRPAAFADRSTPVKAADDDAGYQAQLTKSVDGGVTFTTVFAQNGTFYFNGIDCNPNDVTHCCAVGEGFNDATDPSSEPGGRVHCTTDGGKTWPRTLWLPENATNAFSLFEIRFVSATEIWVCGAAIARTELPLFLHSLDGGKTWTAETENTMIGAIAVSVSFPTAAVGYAIVMNGITQSSSVAKYGN